ncbi:MAG: hypothetical protein SGI86_22970 [Deltaproteobacteria bacterium]|nr:hypothetical protein [Deltaproteobacteria bacterium]
MPQQSLEKKAARHFPCESCGADLEFHIGAQRLKCPYCTFEKDLAPPPKDVSENELNQVLERLNKTCRTVAEAANAGRKEVVCGGCGATAVFEGSLATSECAYCSLAIQLSDAHMAPERLVVDGVLSFAIERGHAHAQLVRWVKSRWFAPNAFKEKGISGKFQGVYLPFFTFDAMTYSQYTGERGDNYTTTEGTGKNRRTVTRIRWQSASGALQIFFDDVLVCAIKNLPEKLVLGLEPWPLEKLGGFQAEMLSGYQSRVYEVDLPEAFATGQARIDDEIRSAVRRDIGGDHQRIHSLSTDYSALKYKHVLLPVWMLSYRFTEKVFQIVVNAQTGEVQGERPWSWVKIGLAVVTAASLVGIGIYFAN